jgi:hypothetical protein
MAIVHIIYDGISYSIEECSCLLYNQYIDINIVMATQVNNDPMYDAMLRTYIRYQGAIDMGVALIPVVAGVVLLGDSFIHNHNSAVLASSANTHEQVMAALNQGHEAQRSLVESGRALALGAIMIVANDLRSKARNSAQEQVTVAE